MRHVTAWALAPAGAANGAEPGAADAPNIEHASRVKMQTTWPGAVDREAYVVLEFDLLAHGKKTNIRLLDSGFHAKLIVDAELPVT